MPMRHCMLLAMAIWHFYQTRCYCINCIKNCLYCIKLASIHITRSICVLLYLCYTAFFMHIHTYSYSTLHYSPLHYATLLLPTMYISLWLMSVWSVSPLKTRGLPALPSLKYCTVLYFKSTTHMHIACVACHIAPHNHTSTGRLPPSLSPFPCPCSLFLAPRSLLLAMSLKSLMSLLSSLASASYLALLGTLWEVVACYGLLWFGYAVEKLNPFSTHYSAITQLHLISHWAVLLWRGVGGYCDFVLSVDFHTLHF